MSKNLTRKGLALATALSFGLTGLSALPASAAAGDVVSIAPTSGTGWGSYDTETFSVATTVDTDAVTASAYDKLAIQLTSPDSENVTLKLSDGVAAGTVTTDDADNSPGDVCTFTLADVLLTDSNGETTVEDFTATVTTAQASATCNDTHAANATFTIDFSDVDGGDWVKAVVDLSGVDATADVVSVISSASSTAGSNTTVGFTSFLDTDGDEVLESADKVSKTETVNFYDITKVNILPRIERFVGSAANFFNEDDNSNDKLGVSVQFSPALNLDQLTTANLDFDVTTAANAATSNVAFAQKYLDGATTYSPAGKLYGTAQAAAALAAGTAYKVSAYYTGARATTVNTTSGYTVPAQTDVTTDIADIDGVAVSSTDSAQDDSTDTGITLRAGTKSFTYTSEADEAKANVPVLAVVTASDLAADGSLTVGSKKLVEGESALVSGVTNADGKFAVSVSSALAKSGEDYDVTFYVLLTTGNYEESATFTATYETAAVTTFAAESDVVAGASATVKLLVKDQFGKAISTNAAGKALSVKLAASDTDNLEKFAAVANGSVSFTFTNYLSKGENDNLTATLGTGLTSDDFATESLTDSISLYNPEAAAAVTVSDVIEDAEITYDAFITGTSNADTNVAPADADAIAYTGTVTDADGQGIPGAVVTVSATGLQFQNDAVAGADYYKDTITLAADTAGAFDLNVWAHKVSSTGITITVTSGGKTATTKLTTTANSNVTAEDVVFSWNAPKDLIAVDTTYIVTAKVADKWGNPVSGANLDFSADGAIQINSLDAVENKLTNASGLVRVYIRSLTKTLGVGTVTATLDSATIGGTALADLDVADTSAEEDVLSADLEVRNALSASITKAATSSAVVKNASGLTVKLVRGTKSVTKTATSNSYKISLKGGSGTVKVYVNGVLVASKK